MKKAIFAITWLLGIGAILYQNQGRIFLILLADHSLTPPTEQTANTTTSSLAPPYKNGTYTGSSVDAFYGNIQVQVTISNNKIDNIRFLQGPNAATRSVIINTIADPDLAQEAIKAQNPNVDIISGATDSSQAFVQSLTSALTQAKG